MVINGTYDFNYSEQRMRKDVDNGDDDVHENDVRDGDDSKNS